MNSFKIQLNLENNMTNPKGFQHSIWAMRNQIEIFLGKFYNKNDKITSKVLEFFQGDFFKKN